MLNQRLVERKLDFIQKELAFLKEYEHLTLKELVSDYKTHTIIERVLERIINSAIDINQHIIAESTGTDIPSEYKETFQSMAKMDIFPEGFADVVSKSAGLRNVLIHDYQRLDEEKFYKSIKICLRDYTKYYDYILKYLDHATKD